MEHIVRRRHVVGATQPHHLAAYTMNVSIVKDVLIDSKPAGGKEAVASLNDVDPETCTGASFGGGVQARASDINA